MNDKQSPECLVKQVEELQEQVENLTNRLSWRNTGSPNGLRRFMTNKQYDAQTPRVQKWYEPIRYEVPEWWKLVPVEPTEKMWCSAQRIASDEYSLGVYINEAIGMYRAMLAAAPEYKP